MFEPPAHALETPIHAPAPLPPTSDALHLQHTGASVLNTMTYSSEQQRSTPLTANFINAVTAADGSGVVLNAKQRKRRSDFGKKRRPREVQTVESENLTVTVVNSQ